MSDKFRVPSRSGRRWSAPRRLADVEALGAAVPADLAAACDRVTELERALGDCRLREMDPERYVDPANLASLGEAAAAEAARRVEEQALAVAVARAAEDAEAAVEAAGPAALIKALQAPFGKLVDEARKLVDKHPEIAGMGESAAVRADEPVRRAWLRAGEITEQVRRIWKLADQLRRVPATVTHPELLYYRNARLGPRDTLPDLIDAIAAGLDPWLPTRKQFTAAQDERIEQVRAEREGQAPHPLAKHSVTHRLTREEMYPQPPDAGTVGPRPGARAR